MKQVLDSTGSVMSGGTLTSFLALLAGRQFQFASLFKFDLKNGGSLYYCSADTPIRFASQTYLTAAQAGAIFERKGSRAKVKWRTGVEVDTLVFDVLPNDGVVNGQTFLSAVRQGVFDGADMTFYHAYWPKQSYVSPIVPQGIVTMFAGRAAGIVAGRTLITFTINSYLNLLNQNLPRNIYQSGCINTLYDAGCTLNPASFGVSGTAAAGTTASTLKATMAQASGYFDMGKITFTSGVNNGISRSVKQYTIGTPGDIALMSPFPNTPAPGDTFTAFPGCDKLPGTCTAKFSNLANFRGFPFIPENQTGV